MRYGRCKEKACVISTECDERYGRWKEAVKRCLNWHPPGKGGQELSHNRQGQLYLVYRGCAWYLASYVDVCLLLKREGFSLKQQQCVLESVHNRST